MDCENQLIKSKLVKFMIFKNIIRVYLHYHDYLLDGRWVVTEDINSDDKTAVVRNLGDGWDDEECPEKESYVWQLRSKKSPGVVIRSNYSTS